MSKVKQRAAVTGVRNVKAKKGSVTGKPKKAIGSGRASAKASSAVSSRGGSAARKKASAVKPPRAKISRKSPSKSALKKTAKTASKRVVAGRRKSTKAAPDRHAGKGPKGRAGSVVSLVASRGGRAGRLDPVARYAIKPLDPLRKCGPDTSVQFLYRVDESLDGRTTAHLVFFDRHGWYCEHGRTCPAVAPARKYNGHIARVS